MSAAPSDDVMAVQGQCIGYSVLSKSCLFLDLILTKSLDAEHIDPSTGLPEFTPTVAPENDNDAVVNHVGTHVKRHEPIQIPIVRQTHEVISVCLTAASFEGYDALMTTLQKPRIGDVFEGTVQPSTRGKSAKTSDREHVGENELNSGQGSNVVAAEPTTTEPSHSNGDKPWVADKDAKQNIRVTGLTLTLVRRGIVARPGDFGVKWLQRREGAKKKNPPPQPTKDEREAASVTADGLTLISASKRFQVFATFCYRMMHGRYPVFDENLRYQPFTCPLLPSDEAKLPPPPPPPPAARHPQSSHSDISPSAPAEVAPSTSDEKMPELSTASARPNDSSAPETVVSVNGRPQLQSAAPFSVLDVAGGAGRLSCKLRDLGFAPTVIDPRAREMMLGGKAEAGRLSKRQRREIRKAVEKRQREEEGDGDGTNDQPTCDQHRKEEESAVNHAPTAAPTPTATGENEDDAVAAEDAAVADDEDAPDVEDNAGKGNSKVSQPKRSAEWAAAESLIWQPPSYNDFFVSTDDAQKALISSSDLIVGLHCDGAVNEIIAAACSFRKNFVICACCVFPNQYPRSLQDGTPVVSREELNMWIVEEARRQGFPGTVDTVRLPMHGANQVVFGVVGPTLQ